MEDEIYNKAQSLHYRISRYNNLISAFTNCSPYQDVKLGDKEDEKEIIELCASRIEKLKGEIKKL